MNTYIHTHTHTHKHAYIHTSTHTNAQTHAHTHTYAYNHTHTHTGASYSGLDTKEEAMEPTLVLCVEAFANTLLVPSGHVTFKDVYAAFKTQVNAIFVKICTLQLRHTSQKE